MSTQNAILSVLSSKKLWTAPSKEQYLPLHMKELCEDYMKSESPHRFLPVELSLSIKEKSVIFLSKLPMIYWLGARLVFPN